ncbi:recombinase RecT [Maritalea porphyrae]|uniref:recombinase RecT n=1 Tax=Maritalea porphyrae TaxID=880732 RepID=UPI0022AF9FC7|nr:recombinase RecT [Maritalea porphyrae]MCZ4270770.1 recombinase RecT [Maritalea porphyrae]
MSNNHLVTTDIEARIANKVDPEAAKSFALSTRTGGVDVENMSQVMEFAKMMAVSDVAVPKHLRANPGACLAIVIQAFEWQMSPFAVANKSYSVNDRLAFEAQLLHAVILNRAPIDGRPNCEYFGDGQERSIRIWATLKNGQEVEYVSPKIKDIKPQNSPLWKNDPDQQLFYFGARGMARRHFPDVILGIYAADELEGSKDITPKQHGENSGLAARLTSRNSRQTQTGFQADAVAQTLGDEQPDVDPNTAIEDDARRAAASGKPRELPPIWDEGEPEADVWFAAYDAEVGNVDGGEG